MRAVQGALIVASSIQIILGYSQLWAICSRCNFHLNRSLFQYYILFIDEMTVKLCITGFSAHLEWSQLFPWWVLACLIEASQWYCNNYQMPWTFLSLLILTSNFTN